jgi:hypothetical protein
MMPDRIAKMLVSDKALRIVGYLTVVLVTVMVVMTGLTIPGIVSNTTSAQRNDNLASCRAEFRAKVDDANIVLLNAFGEVQTGISEAIVASIRQDPTTLALIAADLQTAEAAKHEALVELTDAAADYSDAVRRSRIDPDGFLDDCAKR